MRAKKTPRKLPLFAPLANYVDYDHEAIREMMLHPSTVLGLSDGGAHCGVICDASSPSYLLTHWARDRKRGPKIRLEHAVHRMTQHTARLYGLLDRGVLSPQDEAARAITRNKQPGRCCDQGLASRSALTRSPRVSINTG